MRGCFWRLRYQRFFPAMLRLILWLVRVGTFALFWVLAYLCLAFGNAQTPSQGIMGCCATPYLQSAALLVLLALYFLVGKGQAFALRLTSSWVLGVACCTLCMVISLVRISMRK